MGILSEKRADWLISILRSSVIYSAEHGRPWQNYNKMLLYNWSINKLFTFGLTRCCAYSETLAVNKMID